MADKDLSKQVAATSIYTGYKKLNYFNTQFLTDVDFKDEQSFHLDMMRRHNAQLHIAGIIEGLVLGIGGDRKTVTLTPGSAIDPSGKEIVVVSGAETKIPQPDFSKSLGQSVAVVISWGEQKSPDAQDQYTGGTSTFTRWVPNPTLSAVPPTPSTPFVVLAQVSVAADGTLSNLDTTVRVMAGSRITRGSNVQLDNLVVGVVGQQSITAASQRPLTIVTPTGSDWLFLQPGQADGGFYLHSTADTKTPTTSNLEIGYRSATPKGTQASNQLVLQSSTGNVGIGTNTPNTSLVISKPAQGAVGPIVTLYNTAGSTGAGGAIDFNGFDVGTNDSAARIRSLDDGKFSSHLAFFTKEPDNVSNSLKERVRISSNGKVGIGTDDPKTPLHVSGVITADNTSAAPPQTGAYGATGDRLVLWAGSNQTYPYSLGIDNSSLWYSVPADARHTWYVAGSEKMRLAPTGKLGIGTTTPADLLSLAGGGLSFQQATDTVSRIGIGYDTTLDTLSIKVNSTGAGGSLDTLALTVGVSGNHVGNVGVGTVPYNPPANKTNYLLDIAGTTRILGNTNGGFLVAGARLTQSGTLVPNAGDGIIVANTQSGSTNYLVFADATGKVFFTIDTNGNALFKGTFATAVSGSGSSSFPVTQIVLL